MMKFNLTKKLGNLSPAGMFGDAMSIIGGFVAGDVTAGAVSGYTDMALDKWDDTHAQCTFKVGWGPFKKKVTMTPKQFRETYCK